jgi:hypothetical protein
MPDLQEIYDAQPEGGIEILAVNLLYQESTQADVQNFVNELDLTFPILLDPDGEVAVDYRVGSLPTSIFLDAEGRVHLVQIGPVSENFVKSVLREMR